MQATVDEEIPIVQELAGYVTASRAAEMLHTTVGQVYWAIRMKKLKAVRLDQRTWLITKRSVERYKRHRESPGYHY